MRTFTVGLAFVLAVFAAAAGGDGEQVLSNALFDRPGEDGAAPEFWRGPVLLEQESEPELADFVQRSGYAAEYGEFVGYLRYSSTEPQGLAGLAYEQTEQEFGEVTGSESLCLSYRILYQYGSGVDHASDHAGLVEVELHAEDEVYRLRYLHPRKGELPSDTDRIAHVDAGDPGYRTWSSYEHDLDQDISLAFPDLTEYQVTAVRLGILTQRDGAEATALYWLFDKAKLYVAQTHEDACP